MDMNALVDQILARVAEKMAQQAAPSPCSVEAKPGLLVLSPEHGTHCHEGLESSVLSEHYKIDCALRQDYQVDVQDYDVVILYGLSIEAMSKLASGTCDTPFTSLAVKALLLGKPIFVPTEEVELYHYTATAPAVYYAMMEEKLKLLTASGVVLCAQANLEHTVLSRASEPPSVPCSMMEPVPTPVPCKETKEKSLSKRVITERDILAAKEEGVTTLHVSEKSILTDLAKDMAKTSGVVVVRT